MRITVKSTILLSTAFLTLLAVGCGSSGSRKSSASTTAPTTSGNATGTTSGTTGATSSGAAFDPQGQILAVSSTSNAVQANLALDAYFAFKEQQSISDLVFSSDPTLADRAFVVEDRGTLRILDMSGAAPTLDRSVDLFASALPVGITTGKLNVQSADQALLVTSGQGGEGVAVFSPSTAQVASDVVWFDFNSITAQWPVGTLDSQGADVGGNPLPMSYTSDAVISGNKLFYTSSNLGAGGAYNPGTLTAYDYDPITHTLSGGAFLKTSVFNPSGITRVSTTQGELLLVTNSGPYGAPEGSIDVFDPTNFSLIGTITFPASTNPSGQLTISPDGKHGYVASMSTDEVYMVNLENLDTAFGQTNVDMSARFRGGFKLGSAATTNFVSSLAVSHTGNYLYVTSFNESALYVVDLNTGERAARITGFERTGLPSNFEGLANKVGVRPGVPGTDFQGPSVFVMTINLATADRTLQDVTVTLDAVEVDKH